MSLGVFITIGLVVVVLLGALFTLINEPVEIDAEEERAVEKELKKKKRWWRRR